MLCLNMILGNCAPYILRKALNSVMPYVDKAIIGWNGNDKEVIELLDSYPKIERFTQVWDGDFAKARNEVLDKTPKGTLVIWLDEDDELLNGQELIDFCKLAFAQEPVKSIAVEWFYAHDKHGNCSASLWRERVVRTDLFRWCRHPLHETLDYIGADDIPNVICENAKIKHLATYEKMLKSGKRNLDIITKQYEKEVQEGKLSNKTIYDTARSYQGVGELDKAVELFKDYINNGVSDEEKCITYTIIGEIYKFQGKVEESKRCALQTIMMGSNIPDGYIDLASCLFIEGKHHPASVFLETSFKFKPCKSFPINPMKYSVQPMKILAACYMYLGEFEKAVKCANYVLSKIPDDARMKSVIEIGVSSLEQINKFDKENNDKTTINASGNS